MPRYDYDAAYRYGRDYAPPAGARYRMGLHDFSEHYGRYSGGPPYGYEYSERTIVHPHPPGSYGFSRPLRRGQRRPRRYGREFRRR